MTVTYSKYRMIPDELQGHDSSDEDEDEYFTQDDARIELPTKLRESFIIFGRSGPQIRPAPGLENLQNGLRTVHM